MNELAIHKIWKGNVCTFMSVLERDPNIQILKYLDETTDFEFYYTDREAPAFQRIWVTIKRDSI